MPPNHPWRGRPRKAVPVTPAAELVADYLTLPARALSDDPVTAVLVAAVAVMVILGALGRAHELRDRRAAAAIAVQGEITDALLRDPALLGLSLTPTARVRRWGSRVTVKVAGEVPSRALRKAALRAAERGAAELLVRVRIKSRIRVVRPRARRVA
jgi:hypothetical protein